HGGVTDRHPAAAAAVGPGQTDLVFEHGDHTVVLPVNDGQIGHRGGVVHQIVPPERTDEGAGGSVAVERQASTSDEAFAIKADLESAAIEVEFRAGLNVATLGTTVNPLGEEILLESGVAPTDRVVGPAF